jgi:hypothetical protein
MKQLIAIVLIFISLNVFAQWDNHFYVNKIGGDGSLISINYERLHRIDYNFTFIGKFGVGYNRDFNLCLFNTCSNHTNRYMVLSMYGGILTNITKNTYLEFTVGSSSITEYYYILYPSIGYRAHIPIKDNYIIFRVYNNTLMLEIGKPIDSVIIIPFGVSMGFMF